MNIPTEMPPNVVVANPGTGMAAADLLQKLNEIIRALREIDARLTAGAL